MEKEGILKIHWPTAKSASVVPANQDYWYAPLECGRKQLTPCWHHAKHHRCGISVDALGYTQCPIGGVIDTVLNLHSRNRKVADLFDPHWTDIHIKKLCAGYGCGMPPLEYSKPHNGVCVSRRLGKRLLANYYKNHDTTCICNIIHFFPARKLCLIFVGTI